MIIAPNWACRLRYYCDQWLVWIAIGALALLAYKKDQQMDNTLRKLEGVMIHYESRNESLDKRIDTLVNYVIKHHERPANE